MNVYPSPPPQPYHNEHNSAGLEIFVNFLFTKQNSLIVLFLKRFFKQCPHRKFIVTPSTHSMRAFITEASELSQRNCEQNFDFIIH